MNPKEGTIKRRFPRKREDNVIEEEEEEIGVQRFHGSKLGLKYDRIYYIWGAHVGERG